MKPDRQTTLEDVARAAGKSLATVSRALRNHPAISKATRGVVQRLAAEMGYHPNAMVSALMAHVRNRQPSFQENLACLYSTRGLGPVRGMLDELMIGVKEEARKLGYAIDASSLDDLNFCSKTLLRGWRTRRVRGVLLYNTRPNAPLDLPWDEFAWVVCGGITHMPKFHRVGNEIFQIVKIAIKELHRRGYRRPSLAMTTGGEERVGFRWVGAFLANAMHYEMELAAESVFKGKLTREDFVAWQERYQADVVISIDDKPKQWIEEMGQDVPGQTGFLHLAANLSSFAATGIVQDLRTTGRVAIRTLDGELRRNDFGIPSPPIIATVPGTWKEGTTLRPSPTQCQEQADTREAISVSNHESS